MNIYKRLPYKMHHWLILHFGKPCTRYGASGYYELHGWIACNKTESIVNANIWETFKRFKDEITKALEEVGY